MKITIGQIQSTLTNPGFRTFLGRDLPIATSFEFAKLRRKMEEEMVLFQEKKTELLEKYADRDTENAMVVENNSVIISPPKLEKFQAELTDLLNVKINLAGINKIQLDSTKVTSLSGAETDAIYDLVTLIE